MCPRLSFRRSPRQSKVSEYVPLLSLLSNVFVCRGEADQRIWKPCSSSLFSTKSFYSGLEVVPITKHADSLVWTWMAPPRVETFCWLVVSRKVPTMEFLRRRGILSEEFSGLCHLCRLDFEGVDHLFLHCDFSHV